MAGFSERDRTDSQTPDGSIGKLLQDVIDQPFNPVAHSMLGAAYWRQGHVEDALNSITRALELDPQCREAILSSSMVFRDLKREDDAREVLSAYLRARPDDPEIRSMLDSLPTQPPPGSCANVADFLNEQGESQYGNGRLDRARVCFEMAIEANPDHGTAHCNLGVVRLEEGNVNVALEHLYRAMELCPDDPVILHNCFLVLKAAGHFEVASELMQLYLQKGFGDDDAWKEYAELLRDTGNSSWSPEGLSGEVAKVYAVMGSKLLGAGDCHGAVSALERALRIDPHHVEAYVHLGRALKALGETTAALQLIQQGIELHPEDPVALSVLNELTRELNLEKAGTVR
jgi:Flp pilus assembly protein TadD